LLLPAAAEASNGQDLFIISACYFFVIYLSAISVEQRTHAAQLMTAKIGQREDVTPVAAAGGHR